MLDIAGRVRTARKHAKLTQKELAKKAGTTQTVISDIENGRNKSSASLYDIAVATKVSSKWLLKGEGEMLPPPNTMSNDNNVEVINPEHLRKVPVINWVQAGVFTDIAPDSFDEFEYVLDADYGDNIYWLRIKGDSMTPMFNQGDLILVDMDRQPNAGNYVIARLEGEEQATFKRYKPCGFDEKLGKEYCQLIALNEFYPPIDSRLKNFAIVGTVVEHKRSLV